LSGLTDYDADAARHDAHADANGAAMDCFAQAGADDSAVLPHASGKHVRAVPDFSDACQNTGAALLSSCAECADASGLTTCGADAD
jgi:hypothetical protein